MTVMYNEPSQVHWIKGDGIIYSLNGHDQIVQLIDVKLDGKFCFHSLSTCKYHVCDK